MYAVFVEKEGEGVYKGIVGGTHLPGEGNTLCMLFHDSNERMKTKYENKLKNTESTSKGLKEHYENQIKRAEEGIDRNTKELESQNPPLCFFYPYFNFFF